MPFTSMKYAYQVKIGDYMQLHMHIIRGLVIFQTSH